MHTDPVIPNIVMILFSIVALGIVMKWLKQPHVIVYLLVGLLLGPKVFAIITDTATITRFGAFGVVLLLFFTGMEVSPKRLAKNWSISVLGTLLQVLISVILVALIGLFLDWTLERIIMLGFVISISSTAVVLKLLQDWKEIDSRVGQNVLGILLVQDLLVVPMMIILSFLKGQTPSAHTLMLQALGGAIIVALTIWLIIKDEIRLPWLKYLGADHEMQVFVSLGICFGMAMLTSLTALSAALGAFVGGMIIASARETHWVHQSLSSIRTIFIALFFVSIGMLIDIQFIIAYWWQIAALIFASFMTNFLVNAAILKSLGEQWRESLYGGSLLSQIGEFSFVIAAIGFHLNIINQTGYQMTISVIALSLLLSPLWIMLFKNISNITNRNLNKV